MFDPYPMHRLALRPFIFSGGRHEREENLAGVHAIGEGPFIRFLVQQGLAPHWHELLNEHAPNSGLEKHSLAVLAKCHREAAAHYLLQKSTLPKIRDLLDAKGIPHVIYKGAALREWLYKNAALRPAADIDLLLAKENRDKAIRTLTQAGYTLRPNADNASHEVNLQRGALTIDLHWDILRPGRTRAPIVAKLLASRKDAGDYWTLNTASSLFVALVHPVFAKYATAPQSTLIRMLDLERQLKIDGIEHSITETMKLLEHSGLNTAAWIMLQWLSNLTARDSDSAPEGLLRQRTTPGRVRRGYLSTWLRLNLPAKLDAFPLLVQFAFTLAAHDKLQDSRNAMRAIREAGKSQEADVRQLEIAAGALPSVEINAW